MTEVKAAKDALVASLFELSKAAQDAATATVEYYKSSNTDAAAPINSLNNLATTIKSMIPTVQNAPDQPLNANVKPEKKKKVERDPNAPKKPLTMYFAYSFHIRDGIKKERERKGLPALSAIEMNEYVKDRWNTLSPSEKDKWQAKYRQELVVYNKEKEKYKAKLAGKLLPTTTSVPTNSTDNNLLSDVNVHNVHNVHIPPEIQPNLDYDISDLPPQPKLTNLDDSDDDSDEELLKKEKKEKKRKSREEKEKKKKKKLQQQQQD